MNDLSCMKLGKLPPKYLPRLPMLAAYTAALPPAPVAVDWSGGAQSWGSMLNNSLGDCTCAAVGHAIQTWTRANGHISTISDAVVQTLYEQFGYRPGDPSTDQGAVETAVLGYWDSHPVDGHALEGFVGLQPREIRDIRDAVWLLGGVYIGLALPESAQGQVGGCWTVPQSGLSAGPGVVGGWGGHAVFVVAYDSRGLTCVTWGKLQRMSWNFWWAYCDEAYGLLSKDWAPANGNAPSGFNLAALQTDLVSFKRAA